MPDPKAPAVRPAAQIIAPDKLKKAAEEAHAERARIHAAGKQEGIGHAERYRTVGLVAIGFALGFVAASFMAVSLFERGIYSASAVADRVLQRTVEPEDPYAGLERPPVVVRAEGEREGCAPGQRMVGGRRCPPEPPSAPQQRR